MGEQNNVSEKFPKVVLEITHLVAQARSSYPGLSLLPEDH
jgi:hypothetical protein